MLVSLAGACITSVTIQQNERLYIAENMGQTAAFSEKLVASTTGDIIA